MVAEMNLTGFAHVAATIHLNPFVDQIVDGGIFISPLFVIGFKKCHYMPLQIEIKEMPQLSPEKDMEHCVLGNNKEWLLYHETLWCFLDHPPSQNIQDLGNSCPGAL